MATLGDLWKRLKGSPAVLFPSFEVGTPESSPIAGQESYVELRITEQFLVNRREYWNEYIPVTVSLSQFIFDGKSQTVPVVVGPSLLTALEQVGSDDRVRYRDTRLLGPLPYQGDDLTVFIGLFRARTKNWAREYIGLLESFVKGFDATRLSRYIDVAGPVVDGIESFLGMQDQELRVGERRAFTDPAGGGHAALRPGHFVMIRTDDPSLQQADEQERFSVSDGQLFRRDDHGKAMPYRGADYVLYQISSPPTRTDYTRLEFHSEHWNKTIGHIWDGNADSAQRTFIETVAAVRKSAYLTRPDRARFTAFYSAKYRSEQDAYQQAMGSVPRARGAAHDRGQNGEVAAALAVTRELAETYRSRSGSKGGLITEGQIQEFIASPGMQTNAMRNVDPDALADVLVADALNR